MQRAQVLLPIFLLTLSIGCDSATESVSSLKDSVVESVTGSKAKQPGDQQAEASSGDALDKAAEGINGLQDAMAGILGGGSEVAPGSTEAVLPRYQWKANRNGREQARMLSTQSATEDDMKQAAVGLVQQVGGTRWIVAFYSNVQTIEDWPGRTAVDRKSEGYLGSVVLDAGRPPKVRFNAPSSTISESIDRDETPSQSMSDKDAQHAEMLLRSAKRLLASGKQKTAKFQLQAIVRRYPSSADASEALSLLAKIRQQP